MPRHTRNQRRRRLDTHEQQQRERALSELSGELRMLWRQHEGVSNLADQDTGYVDPRLILWRPDAA